MMINDDMNWFDHSIGSDLDCVCLSNVIVVNIELGHSIIVNFLGSLALS
jgi:hypothetical protein